jgi:hypothetical protein
VRRNSLPAIGCALVATLLILGAMPAPKRAQPEAAPTALNYTGCTLLQSSFGTGSGVYMEQGAAVSQPLGTVANVAACSLHTSTAFYMQTSLNLVVWDPLTLAPDPTTVALRSSVYIETQSTYNPLVASYYPPVVLRQLPHLADPSRATFALQIRNSDPYYGRTVYYDAGSASQLPPAMKQLPAGDTQMVPGSHPVLAHALCAGDAALQSLYVAQSVMTTSVMLDTTEGDLLQRFQVPLRTRVSWLEFASGGTWLNVADPGEVAIFEANTATPPLVLPPALVSAPIDRFLAVNSWVSHLDFDQSVTLEPGQDYWFLLRLHHNDIVYARRLTGTESSDFTERIGGLFSRRKTTNEWNARAGLALSFRIIGEPVGVTGAPAPTDASVSLRLSVFPNPSRGVALVAWSGAQGAVRLDVLDVRGRRVGGASGVVGVQGRWTWPAMSNGRALPAGVYFIRAQDERGYLATERLVLIR